VCAPGAGVGSLLLEAVMSAGSSVDGSTPEAMACAAATFLAASVAFRLATAAAMEPLAHRAAEDISLSAISG
jgi:hypothetical protein